MSHMRHMSLRKVLFSTLETHWPEHKKVCMNMLKRSNTFRLAQKTLQKKRDYPADATIEEAVYAMAVGCSAREDQHGR